MIYRGDSTNYLDYELSLYVTEVHIAIRHTIDSRRELAKLWDGGRSKIAQAVAINHNLNDATLRQSLASSCVVGLYMSLVDAQSKCLSGLPDKFRNSTVAPVIKAIFTPLWDEYKQAHAQDIKRLKINRNNLFAHISKKQKQSDILRYSDEVMSQLLPLISDQDAVEMRDERCLILTTKDILGGCALFSDQSFNYLEALISILRFSQTDEIFQSMQNNSTKHLEDFRNQYPTGFTITQTHDKRLL